MDKSQKNPDIFIKKMISEIREDRDHGASYLSQRAVEALKFAALRSRLKNKKAFLDELKSLATELTRVRPSMVPLTNSIGSIIYLLCEEEKKGVDISELKNFIAAKADQFIKHSREAINTIGKHAAELIGYQNTIMTYSWSSTVIEAIKQAKSKDIRVIVSESRPLNEGEKTAEKISSQGIPITFITDAQNGYFIKESDLVLIGADSILSCGSVINKMGTYLLALAAKEAKVPLYILGETAKIDIRSAQSSQIKLEEKEAGEISAHNAANIKVRNIYFDITPFQLITGVITEAGIIKPNQIIQYARAVGKKRKIFEAD